jgi:phosphate:Na+ symporter
MGNWPEIIFRILTILGSLGIFLYGMKLMSEALQRLAGKGLRNFLSAFTSTTTKGILSGFLVTGIIQSSSALTVMVLSLVNAGMMTLKESVGVIMGANIGTTVTAWLVSVVGYGKSTDISAYVLVITAFAVPLLFSTRSSRKATADFIFGFTFLFLGLLLLKENVPMLDQNSGFLQRITHLESSSRLLTILIFIGLGTLLSIMLRSSSAATTLTIVLATERWIPYDMALIMVIGENIGTTSTAIIASLVANRAAKRAAMVHFFFNLFGAVWISACLGPFTWLIDWVIYFFTGKTPSTDLEMIPVGLALFHTGFNLANTLVLAWFTGYIIKFVKIVIPSGKKKKEKYHLTYIEPRMTSISELSLVQARKETAAMGKMAQQLFSLIPRLMVEKDPEAYDGLLKKAEKLERKVDRLEEESKVYLAKLSEGRLSESATREVQATYRIIDEIEAICDAAFHMVESIRIKNEKKMYFFQEQRDRLKDLFELVLEALNIMNINIYEDFSKADISRATLLEQQINKLRDDLLEQHQESLHEERYSQSAGTAYYDLITRSEEVGDHCFNIAEAIGASRTHPVS